MFNLKVGDVIILENGRRKIVMYKEIDEDENGVNIIDVRVTEGFAKMPNQRGRLQRIATISKESVYPEILNKALVIRGGVLVYGYLNLATRLVSGAKAILLNKVDYVAAMAGRLKLAASNVYSNLTSFVRGIFKI